MYYHCNVQNTTCPCGVCGSPGLGVCFSLRVKRRQRAHRALGHQWQCVAECQTLEPGDANWWQNVCWLFGLLPDNICRANENACATKVVVVRTKNGPTRGDLPT